MLARDFIDPALDRFAQAKIISVQGEHFPVVLTRTSAAVTSRALRNVQEQLDQAGIAVFATAIVERAAFRDLFDYGGALEALDPVQVSNVEKARINAQEFAGEVLARLKAANQLAEAV